MWFHFKILLRRWNNRKLYPLISFASLITGLSCAVLLIGFVLEEYRIADSVPNSRDIYLIEQKSDFYRDEKIVHPYTLRINYIEQLQQTYPEIGDYCIFHQYMPKAVINGREFHLQDFYEVLPAFSDFFHPHVTAGDLKRTLSNTHEIAVTKTFAREQFGEENPIGKQFLLIVQNGWEEKTEGHFHMKTEEVEVTVTAVIDNPKGALLNYQVLWGMTMGNTIARKITQGSYYTFVRLQPGCNPTTLQERISSDSLLQETTRNPIYLKPMKEVYFIADNSKLSPKEELISSRDRSLLLICTGIALLLLVIACFNYINIGMTYHLERIRNTGLQLVMGASKRQVKTQLILETLLQFFFALMVSFLFIVIFLYPFNRFMESHVEFSSFFKGSSIFFWLILILLLSVLPSLYIYSSLTRTPVIGLIYHNRGERKALVPVITIAQFTLSCILLIFMQTVNRQMDFITHSRPQSEAIISIEASDSEMLGMEYWRSYLKEIKSLAAIEDYTISWILNTGQLGSPEGIASTLWADERFLDFYQIPLLEGKNFKSYGDMENNVLVNEAFVRQWNLKDPVGKKLNLNGKRTIIGIIPDFTLEHFSIPIQPLMVERYSGEQDEPVSFFIKINPDRKEEIIGELERLWQTHAPEAPPLLFKSMAEIYLNLHHKEYKLSQTISFFSCISLLLTCLGLFGLAWYSTEYRNKEIGMRKINGATEKEIIFLLCFRFTKWIATGFLFALPVSIFLVRNWLNGFVYKTNITPGIFIRAGLFILFIGLLTVAWQSVHAARKNPINILKTE